MRACSPLKWESTARTSSRVITTGNRLGGRAYGVGEAFELAPEDFAIKEEEGGERLVLRGGRHLTFDREMREELDDLDCSHLIGVSNTVVVDVPPDPTDVGLLGSQGVVANAKRDPHAVEQLGRTRASGLAHDGRLPGTRGTPNVVPTPAPRPVNARPRRAAQRRGSYPPRSGGG
jgi:hypothetical protein